MSRFVTVDPNQSYPVRTRHLRSIGATDKPRQRWIARMICLALIGGLATVSSGGCGVFKGSRNISFTPPWSVGAVPAEADSRDSASKRDDATSADVSTVTDDLAARKASVRESLGRQRDLAEYHAALQAFNNMNYSGSKRGVQAILERNPTHEDAELLLVDIFLRTGQLDAACEASARLVARLPDDPVTQYVAAISLDADGQSDRALSHYRVAAELAPDNELYVSAYEEALENQASPVQRTAYEMPLESLHSAPQTRSADPADLPEDHFSRLDSSECFDGSEHAGDLADLLAKGCGALDRGDIAAAIAHFQAGDLLNPCDPTFILAAGHACLVRDRASAAICLLTPAADRYYQAAAFHRMLGVARYRVGDLTLARESFLTAVSLDNSDATAYVLLGCVSRSLGEDAEAQRHWRQALRLDPSLAGRLSGFATGR